MSPKPPGRSRSTTARSSTDPAASRRRCSASIDHSSIEPTKYVDGGVDVRRARLYLLRASAKLGYKGYESGDLEQLAVLTKWLGY